MSVSTTLYTLISKLIRQYLYYSDPSQKSTMTTLAFNGIQKMARNFEWLLVTYAYFSFCSSKNTDALLTSTILPVY
jgi:hypothetical protein